MASRTRSGGKRKRQLSDEDEDEEEEEEEEKSKDEIIEELKAEIKEMTLENLELRERLNKRLKNIFKTSPSSVDEETFGLLYPFLGIVIDSWPPYNHVDFVKGKEVFEMAGTYALDRVRRGIQFFRSGVVQGENQDKHHMLKLLEAVGDLSLPDSDSGNVKFNPGRTECVTEANGAESSSDEDIYLATEKKSEFNSWRMDIGCSIINKAMKTTMEGVLKGSMALHGPSDWKWILRLAIECKEGKILTRDFYQAVMYVITYVQDRFQKQFPIDPVYTQVWTPEKWRVGLVDILGFVRIRNRKLDTKSLDQYEGRLRERFARRGAKEDVARHYTREALQVTFRRAQKELVLTHGYHYADGWYPVGNVYMSSEELDFPRRSDGEKAMEHPHTKRFFQVLVRILLGNKMLNRNEEHLISVLEERTRRERDSLVLSPATNEWPF